MTNKQVVINFFDAIDHNDFATAKKLLGPRHQIFSPMSPGAANADEHLAISKAFHEGFSQGKHEWNDIIECGNKVVTRGTWYGVHTGEFNGIPPTGNNIQLSSIMICEIENEEIINQWVEMDSMSLLKQLDVMPEPIHT